MIGNRQTLTLNSIQFFSTFSIAALRSFLVLYLAQDLLLSQKDAISLYAGVMSLMYLTPLVGGVFAGRFISSRMCMLTALCLSCMGMILLSFPLFFAFPIGLSLFVCGSGLLKPLVPLLLDMVFSSSNKNHGEDRERGYTLYYVVLNVGALLGPLLCGLVKKYYGWPYGFMTACLSTLMALFLAVRFVRFEPQNHQKFSPKNTFLFLSVVAMTVLAVYFLLNSIEILSSAFPFILASTLPVFIYIYVKALPTEKKSLLVAFAFMGCFCLSVSLFEQSGGSISLFIDKRIERTLFGFSEIPTSVFQMLNPLYIILLALLMRVMTFQKTETAKHYGLKLSFGFFSTALGFTILTGAALLGGKVGPSWIFAAFLFTTLGEFCVFPICLSAVTKFSPPRIRGLMLALLALSVGYGHYFAGFISCHAPSFLPLSQACQGSLQELNFEGIFLFVGLLSFLISVLIFLATLLLKRD